MRRSILFNFIQKRITESIYKKVREQEQKLSPDNFTAYYSLSSIMYWIAIFLIFAAFTYFGFDFFEKILLYIVGIGAVGSFLITLYHISYRCFIDDAGIKVRIFWFFEKQILWEDIKKVDVQESHANHKAMEKDVILRNKQNKIVYTCSYELVGFELIVKKAKKEHRKNNK